MGNPYISIFSTRNLSDRTRELANLWGRFVSNTWGDIKSDKIRRNILESWKRCQENEVNPKQLQTNSFLTDLDLKNVLKESELYKIAKPIIDDFFQRMIGTGYIITLSNQNGYIIYLKGEKQIWREAEKMNFVPGMDWSEKSAGTNAIGTSLVTGAPIQILAAEHFCQGCHPWTCSAAPITHPFTKEIIGSIDFTGFWGNAQPHTLALAVSIAQIIENQLTNIYLGFNFHLIDSYFQGKHKWKTGHILMLNPSFYTIKSSDKLAESFELPPGTDLKLNLRFHSLINELKQVPLGTDVYYPTKEIKISDYLVQSIERIIYSESFVGYRVIFTEKHKKALHSPSRLILHEGQWKEVIGSSEKFLTALYKCQKAAPSNVPILLLGESGTGKEKIAQSIHKSSTRSDQPFLAINCGALQKELIGSELFGYDRGAFTGALKDGKKGKFEEAHGGTLFLDEIGEIPLELQVHLLRVLQEKEITRIGSSKPISVNVRIIAATNKNLYDLCKNGHFREDLFFRLNLVSVNIPPLRERKDDLTLITEYFLKQFSQKYGKELLSLSKDIYQYFSEYSWPGNIRELQNVLEHAVIFCDSSVITFEDLPSYFIDQRISCSQTNQKDNFSLFHVEEQKVLVRLLNETNWNLSEVAKRLKIARSTLYRKLKKYQLLQNRSLEQRMLIKD